MDVMERQHGWPEAGARRFNLAAAKDDQRNLGRHAEANRSAYGAQAAIDVETRCVRSRVGAGLVGLSLDVNLVRRLEQRPLEQSRNVIRDEPRRRQTVIENFHLDLPAVRVPRERKFDAEFGSAIETVGIVRQQNVRDVPAYKRLDVRERLRSMAVEVAFFLVIDADEVELRATKFEDGVFLAQHLHAMLRVKLFGKLFRVRIDLVIAVAAEDTERRMKAANLFDAIFDRVVRS